MSDNESIDLPPSDESDITSISDGPMVQISRVAVNYLIEAIETLIAQLSGRNYLAGTDETFPPYDIELEDEENLAPATLNWIRSAANVLRFLAEVLYIRRDNTYSPFDEERFDLDDGEGEL